jgi:DNA segregation ATPase FtsK/SpoIIIE-like protein
MVTSKKECLPLLQRIAAVGRAAKVHLIVCTQSVLVQFLPSSIRCNIPVTVGLKTANKMQSNFLVQSAGCELLPDPKTTGTGYALVRDGALLEKVRIHKYDDNYIYGLINYWTSKKCIA